jgi:hypothetical protein
MPYARTTTGAHVATELVALYRHQLEGCRLERGESCLIITDTAWDATASAACLGAALALDAKPIILTLPYGSPFPGATLASTMAEADLIVGVTTHRLHYDPHLRAALDGGARALLAVQPTHVLHRLAADSGVVARTRSGAERLAKATTLTIGSERGTELSMAVSNRPALAHYGVADEPGHFDFWGAAMVEIAPLEGSVEGTLVLGRGDQIFHLGRYVDEQVTIQFERGRAVAIEGGQWNGDISLETGPTVCTLFAQMPAARDTWKHPNNLSRWGASLSISRGARIQTGDLLLPKQMDGALLWQAALGTSWAQSPRKRTKEVETGRRAQTRKAPPQYGKRDVPSDSETPRSKPKTGVLPLDDGP